LLTPVAFRCYRQIIGNCGHLRFCSAATQDSNLGAIGVNWPLSLYYFVAWSYLLSDFSVSKSADIYLRVSNYKRMQMPLPLLAKPLWHLLLILRFYQIKLPLPKPP
jgi:hypothetical protein